MVVTYEPWVVLLSVLVAIQGAYVGLKLALELRGTSGARRRLLLAGAAVTLAVAIWSMHFVGMLAVRSPVRIDYLVLPTIISFLVCVVVVGFGVFLASSAPASKPVLAVSALVMGAGIVTMHFTGMLALHANAMMHHEPLYVVLSFVVGVFASGLAVFFCVRGHPPPAARPRVHRAGARDRRHALHGHGWDDAASPARQPADGGHRSVARPAGRDRRHCGLRQHVRVPVGTGA
jgi:NO-binding membrane sensor protein with MHYT domain